MNHSIRFVLFSLLSLFFLTLPAFAIAGSLPRDRLTDPVLEQHAQHLFTQLRCLVCQNQTIADSDARIAQDLRLMVRTRLAAGESEQAILDFIHSRYGDFVLMSPPVRPLTWGLWFGPFIILAGGGVAVAMILRSQKRPNS
ncbi:MAG TPA: cytochrome c-type biogenesis protein [Micavibrio sp.]|jgi:cytochrome c-type biogenesis protein CcmH